MKVSVRLDRNQGGHDHAQETVHTRRGHPTSADSGTRHRQFPWKMMFRRIELIHQLTPREHRAFLKALGRANNTIEPQLSRFWKSGLMGFSHFGVVQAWAKINKPRRAISKNCRFYFTEEGWKRYGRPTVSACQKVGQEYRIIRIKEKSVEVVYRDKFQIAVRPRRKNLDPRRPLAPYVLPENPSF